ncbi:MAG: orotidine-5'-phosphate decarboxylase [Bacteroidia bacterium]|nr:orotidine-5'-phosphate decarboxylase [Bacteroidia bacterium]MDW8134903.1 orotidine-5'-phosphate decarboxylase [Bacteroidia bacterium]
MSPVELSEQAKHKKSLLCVGLDPSAEALPPEIWQAGKKDPKAIYEYLTYVIQETLPYAIAYKLNTAFYERWGEKGWRMLHQLRQSLPKEVLVIADAKRGDIAHTNSYYARAFFEELGFDAITANPFLGWEALSPFLAWEGRWVFVLLRTTEAAGWQKKIWRYILRERPLEAEAFIGWVWGAHHSRRLHTLRIKCPQDWLLIPGVGAQGGKISHYVPLFPALIGVGRALLQAAHPSTAAQEWATYTASFIPL